jgi:hypothetical protein
MRCLLNFQETNQRVVEVQQRLMEARLVLATIE